MDTRSSARGQVTLQRFLAPGIWVTAIAAGIAWTARDGRPVGLITIGAIALGLVFGAERLVPFEANWNRPRRDRVRDLLHLLVNEGSAVASVASIPLFAESWPGDPLWPTSWPLAAQLAVAVTIADLGITLAHFASHRLEPLWRLHAVHHSVGRLYGLNGLMKHPLHQSVETLAGTAPLLWLGIPTEVGALLALAVAVQLMLQHANVDVRLGRLGEWWAVGPGHRLHHRASALEGDVNFGLFTLVWDRLLGTYRRPAPGPLGFEVGIEDRSDYPVDYLAQLIEPFRPAKGSVGAR